MMKADWHALFCPQCKEKAYLKVDFTGICRLTPDGSEDVGPHTWDGNSACICTTCGFKGVASMFAFEANDAGMVDLRPDDEITFEIIVSGMVTNDRDEAILADEAGVDPQFWDVELRRANMRSGVIDIIAETENIDSYGVADAVAQGLEEMSGAGVEWV